MANLIDPSKSRGGLRQQKAEKLKAELEAGKNWDELGARDSAAAKAKAMAPGLRQKRAAELRAELEGVTKTLPTGDEAIGGDSVFVPDEPEEEDGGPVGQGEYIVKQGDCTNSIAKDTGHFWKTIWNDPANQELKEVRKNPNILLPGDRVTIPQKTLKQEPGEAEMRHRFVRRGEPSMLRVQVFELTDEDDGADASGTSRNNNQDGPDGPTETSPDHEQGGTRNGEEDLKEKPRANTPYVVDVDGEEITGTTDANGCLQIPIRDNAKLAILRIGENTEIDEYEFKLGGVDPITDIVTLQPCAVFLSGSGGNCPVIR